MRPERRELLLGSRDTGRRGGDRGCERVDSSGERVRLQVRVVEEELDGAALFGRPLPQLDDRLAELGNGCRIDRAPDLYELGADPVGVRFVRTAQRDHVSVPTRKPGRRRRDGRGHRVDALCEHRELRAELLDAAFQAAWQLLLRELGERALHLGQLRGILPSLGVRQGSLKASCTRVEIAAELSDLAVLGRERGRRGRNRAGQRLEPVGDDVDLVRHSLLELLVALRERLDRSPELLQRLLVDGRCGRTKLRVDVVDARDERADQVVVGAATGVRGHARSLGWKPGRRRSIRALVATSGSCPSTQANPGPRRRRTCSPPVSVGESLTSLTRLSEAAKPLVREADQGKGSGGTGRFPQR